MSLSASITSPFATPAFARRNILAWWWWCLYRIESYVKYPEVAYDLFLQGYDVIVLDHRGQGRSGRMLADHHRGHVIKFDDYIEDFAQLVSREITDSHYQQRFALAHSMGGAILTRFLAREPDAFDAVALCAPMFGIHLPMPGWLAHRIVDWTERHQKLRDYYAMGTGQWRPLPYLVNMLTHSRERYRRYLRQYADTPEIRVGGPTYHWIRESLRVGEQIIAEADKITTPVLLLQASEDRVVHNPAHNAFSQAMTLAGHPCEGGSLRSFKAHAMRSCSSGTHCVPRRLAPYCAFCATSIISRP